MNFERTDIIPTHVILFFMQYNKQFSDAASAPYGTGTNSGMASSSGMGSSSDRTSSDRNGTSSSSDRGSSSGMSSSSVARSGGDVMASVVGEVESALKSLERERNAETVSDRRHTLFLRRIDSKEFKEFKNSKNLKELQDSKDLRISFV